MSTEDHIVRQLTCEIASMHQQLQGFPPATAKLHYIQLAQELEGYGLEYYPVKVGIQFLHVQEQGCHKQHWPLYQWCCIISKIMRKNNNSKDFYTYW